MGTISMNRNELLRELGVIIIKQQGGVTHWMDGTYFYTILKKTAPTVGSTPQKYLELLSPERVSYGTYANDAKVSQCIADVIVHIWGAEETGSLYENNWDFFYSGATTLYKVGNQKDGASTTTTLAGQDWTVEQEFKAVWAVGSIEFWVGGVLKATHNTNIPTVDMQLFAEWTHTGAIAAHTRAQIKKTGFYP